MMTKATWQSYLIRRLNPKTQTHEYFRAFGEAFVADVRDAAPFATREIAEGNARTLQPDNPELEIVQAETNITLLNAWIVPRGAYRKGEA